jgi:glycosyltransferase involved in cell wall biosynthesis
MRVALFAHRIAQDQPTGIGRYLRELTAALSQLTDEGMQLVLTSAREAGNPRWVKPPVQSRILSGPRDLLYAAWCLGRGPHLERTLGGVDVTHLIQPFPPVRTSSAIVLTVHDLFPLEFPHWYPPSERWTFRRSIHLAVRRKALFAVPSRYVADHLIRISGVRSDRIVVVPHGVSSTFSTPRTAEEIERICSKFGLEPGRFAVSLGALEARKNTVPLIRGLAELDGGNIPLLLVGPDGRGTAAVNSEIHRQDAKVKVIRAGYLGDEEVAGLVQGAAVLVHPAVAEGFGLVPLEAMAAGTPVIATRSSSIPEVVDEAGVLIEDPASTSAWADALRKVIGDADYRASLAVAGEQRAAQFSWQHAAKTMLEIYRDAAGA